MSKLSFRARALDATKPMPVYKMEEVPDLPDFAAINRAVPQMPTGMEKEEECEHHLQRAISAQQAYGHTGALVIPTPEVYEVPKEFLQMLYPTSYKHPRQLIHVQPFSMDQDIPDYDMDSEDEKWLTEQAEKMDIKPLQFEQMMDRLEKSSGQQVVTLKEAKLLLKEDDDLLIAVYDYWLNKRLRTAHPLIPQVKTEKRDGSTNNNPYVAFRRRTEKMQTRKNRKNDETSYEKMLKLKRDLVRACSLLELVRKREKIKREHLHLSVEIFEKRYQVGDFSGQMLSEVMAMKFPRPPAIPAQKPLVLMKPEAKLPRNKPIKTGVQKKRTYKRKSKSENSGSRSSAHRTDLGYADIGSSDEDGFSPAQSDQDDENDPDGPYAFKRKKNCNYHAPLDRLGNWPWCSKEENGAADKKYRYCLTSIPTDKKSRCIGFARRRIGRGGRVLFDRAYTPLDDCWSDLDSLSTSLPNGLPNSNELLTEIKNEWKWFKVQGGGNDASSHCSDQSDSDSDDNGTRRRNCDSVNRSFNKMPIELIRNLKCTNQEELFEMQRKQLERLKPSEESDADSLLKSVEHSFSSQPTSRFSLESRKFQFSLPSMIHTMDASSSVPSSPTLLIPSVSDASSIKGTHDRVNLTNGPVTDDAGMVALNQHGGLEKLNRDVYELNRQTVIDVKPNLETLQANLHSVNFCLPAVPSTEQPGVGTASHSSDNIHVIHAKTFSAAVPQAELRFFDAEQNGNELRLKPEVFLGKIKVEKVNDSAVTMDVT